MVFAYQLGARRVEAQANSPVRASTATDRGGDPVAFLLTANGDIYVGSINHCAEVRTMGTVKRRMSTSVLFWRHSRTAGR